MKKLTYLTFSFALALVMPLVSFAAAPTATQTSTEIAGSSFVAHYKVDTPPAANTTAYLWVGEYLKTPNSWISKSKVVANLPKTGGGYPKVFNAEMEFSEYGIVPGTVYAYAILDKNTGTLVGQNVLDVNTAESLLVRCFTDTGSVPCKNTPKNQEFNASSFTITPATPTQDPNHAGKYATSISIAANAGTTFVAPAPLNIKISKSNGTAPATVKQNFITVTPGQTNSTIFDDLTTGDYTATLYSGNNPASSEVAWKITASAQPPQQPPQQPGQPGGGGQPGGAGGQSSYIGGISMWFNPSDQKVNEDSASLRATISAILDMPADFEVLAGSSPSKISISFKPVLEPPTTNVGLVAGDVRTMVIPFNGLSKGTTYYFLIKNNATGTQSPLWNFTTKGGTTPAPESEMTIFDAESSHYGDPGGFEPLKDTISDKGIVPKCGRTQNEAGTIPVKETRMCAYEDFMQLVSNVIQYALIIIGPIIAIVVMYAGAMIIVLNTKKDPTGQIMEQIHKYYNMLTGAAIGVGIILIAWVLVATIIKELGVRPEFVLLDLFNSK